MSQLPILSADRQTKYDQIEHVHNNTAKAIFLLNTHDKWAVMDALEKALDPGTAEGQWRELDAVIERAQAIALQENNERALTKLAEVKQCRS